MPEKPPVIVPVVVIVKAPVPYWRASDAVRSHRSQPPPDRKIGTAAVYARVDAVDNCSVTVPVVVIESAPLPSLR